MKHTCPGLEECEMVNYDKPPHMFDSQLKQAPDGNELVLTVLYMNTEDNVQVGWGMRFNYCPACGKKLIQEVKMDTKELVRFCKQEIGTMKEHSREEFFEKAYYEEIIGKLEAYDRLGSMNLEILKFLDEIYDGLKKWRGQK